MTRRPLHWSWFAIAAVIVAVCVVLYATRGPLVDRSHELAPATMPSP